MVNSTNHLMTIGEVAKTLGITRRIILNYEAKGLLPPDKKDSATSNRYYSADSLTRIRTIRILQNLGLSLDDIYDYYNGDTDLEPLIARLEKLRDELSLNIVKLKERVKGISDNEIKIVTLPAQTIYCETARNCSLEEKVTKLREVFLTAIKRYGSDTSKRMLFTEHPVGDIDLVTYCFSVPADSEGEKIVNIAEEKALSVFHHGSYDYIYDAEDKLIAYAQENGLELKGTCRHLYLEGPPQHKDPSKYITQVVAYLK